MKVSIGFGAVAAVVVVIVGVLAYRKVAAVGGNIIDAAGDVVNGAVAAVGDAVEAVSPLNNNNVIYKAANTVTGGDNAQSSLGTRIYDFLHPLEAKKLAAANLTGAALRRYQVENAPALGLRIHSNQEDGSKLIFDQTGALVGVYYPWE